MILDNLNISVIYQTTTATITNSSSDTITSVIDYDDEKLSITVNNDNTISISSLTNEKATYENIRVQGSTGDYVYITVNTLVNSTQPTYDILDNETSDYTLGGETVQIGKQFYETESVNVSSSMGYVNDTTLPVINSEFTLPIAKYGTDIVKGIWTDYNYSSYDIKNIFLCVRSKSFSGVTTYTTPVSNIYYETTSTNTYIDNSYKNQLVNGVLAQYTPLVEFDFKKLVFVLKFYCIDTTTNTIKLCYYNDITSTDRITGITCNVYYNGVDVSTYVTFLVCYKSGDFRVLWCNGETVYTGSTSLQSGSTRGTFSIAPSGHRYVLYYGSNAIIGYPPLYKAGYSSVKNVEMMSNNSDNLIAGYTIGSVSADNTRIPSMTNNDFLSWLNDFPFLWSTDGVAPTSVTSSDTNIKYKGDTVNETIITKITDISSIKDIAENKTPSTIDTNTYTDTTPFKHVSNGSYNNNFNKQFLLNKTELSALANTFWGNQTDIINNSKLMGETPLNSVISLRYYPFNLGSFSTQTNINYYCGNYQIGSYETLNTAQDPIIDLGSIYIPKHFNNFLDYDNYTEIELFLPFCESVSLSPREYLDTTLNIKMCVDWNTGACLLYCYQNGILKFTKTGQCATDIAINGRDNATYTQQQINGCINTVNSATSGINSAVGLKGGVSLGGVSDVVSGIGSTFSNAYATKHASNPPISSGTTTTTLGLYKPLYPYIIFRYSQPLDDLTNYGKVHGYACYYNTTLGACKGFTVCDNIDINKLKCTSDEKTQILQYLTSGVIL